MQYKLSFEIIKSSFCNNIFSKFYVSSLLVFLNYYYFNIINKLEYTWVIPREMCKNLKKSRGHIVTDFNII